MPENEHKHDVVIVVSQELPSAVEVTAIPDNMRIEEASLGRFGSEGSFDPENVRNKLLNLEKHIDRLREVPSDYPPITSPELYAKLNARFLARISARSYRENKKLKTYAFDLGVMENKIYLFLIIEKVDLKIKQKKTKVAPLSSVAKAPIEWLEGINPDMIKLLLPADE